MRNVVWPARETCTPSIGPMRDSSPMSAPATNAFSPLPVTMTTRTLSSSRTSRTARSSWLTVSAFSALSLSGRFTVMIAIPSLSRSSRIVLVSAMSAPFELDDVGNMRRRCDARKTSAWRPGAAYDRLDHAVRSDPAFGGGAHPLCRDRLDPRAVFAQLRHTLTQQQSSRQLVQLPRMRLLPDLPRADQVALRPLDVRRTEQLPRGRAQLAQQCVARLVLTLRRRADVCDERTGEPARHRRSRDRVRKRPSTAQLLEQTAAQS